MTGAQHGGVAGAAVRLPSDVLASCVDGATFRAIMGAFPSGVAIVTTVDADGRPVGLTCSATCSVSQNPPLLLVCLNRGSGVLRALLHRGGFVVNFLRDAREHVSSRFATRDTDRFSTVAWQPTESGLPWLPLDTIAHAECRVVATLDAGDHTVVVGAIVAGQAGDDTLGPLMYWRRRYGHWPTDEDLMTVALTMATEG